MNLLLSVYTVHTFINKQCFGAKKHQMTFPRSQENDPLSKYRRTEFEKMMMMTAVCSGGGGDDEDH